MRHVISCLLCACLPLAACDDAPSAPPKSTSSSSRTPASTTPAADGRLTVGPLSFLPLDGWDIKPTRATDGIAMFAPEKPAWKDAGFRPNLGVRRRPDPGVTIQRYRAEMDKLLSQSAKDVSAQVSRYLKRTGEGDGKSVHLEQTGKYTLDLIDLGGERVVESEVVGVFRLPTGMVATKTLSVQAILDDGLFTASLTFPLDAADEMQAVWERFKEGVRFR